MDRFRMDLLYRLLLQLGLDGRTDGAPSRDEDCNLR
jgi:hypothetical protein